jgi:Spy/CpxP family protein refolding chaperone
MRQLYLLLSFIFLLSAVDFSFAKIHQYQKDDLDPLDDGVVVLNKKTNSFELTGLQEEQIKYFLLEQDSKLAVLQNDLDVRKKTFTEELFKPNQDIDSSELEKLVIEIQEIVATMERVKIDTELNIRNILTPRQYSVFVQEQKEQEQKKNKKKKKKK